MMMMDKQLVRQCDMEVMKMAMLKHEETFRQQVNELHRLYRVQRQLMSDMGRAEPAGTRRRSKQPRRALDLQLPADEYIGSADEDDAGAELELTLAIGGGGGGGVRKNRRQHERNNSGGSSPFASDCSGTSLSSAEYYSDDAPAVFHAPPAPAPAPPCQRAMAFDLGDGMMRQQAPWLVQCQYLSLRMT
ncbi:hypothetical protein ACP4OV_022856 [Aristida adscensionis]